MVIFSNSHAIASSPIANTIDSSLDLFHLDAFRIITIHLDAFDSSLESGQRGFKLINAEQFERHQSRQIVTGSTTLFTMRLSFASK